MAASTRSTAPAHHPQTLGGPRVAFSFVSKTALFQIRYAPQKKKATPPVFGGLGFQSMSFVKAVFLATGGGIFGLACHTPVSEGAGLGHASL